MRVRLLSATAFMNCSTASVGPGLGVAPVVGLLPPPQAMSVVNAIAAENSHGKISGRNQRN